MRRSPQSGARFAVTTGDNAYDVGQPEGLRRPRTRPAPTRARVFGPNFWKVPGASMPLFPTLGNHGSTTTPAPRQLAAGHGGRDLRRPLPDRDLLLPERHDVERTTRAPGTRSTPATRASTCSTPPGTTRNSGTADVYKNDYDYHWAPGSDQYQWLAERPRHPPAAAQVRLLALPAVLGQPGRGLGPLPPGRQQPRRPSQAYSVTLGFSGHAHFYQRFNAPAGGIPTYATGGGGAPSTRSGRRAAARSTPTGSAGTTRRASAAPAAARRSRRPRIGSTTSCS